MDVLLATGEQTTIALLAMAIDALGARAVSLTGAQAGIVTDGVHTKAKIANITPKQILHHLDEGAIVIVAGFQGQTMDGQITTLGRGGSDLTAIAIASAIGADLCQIFTDVDGVYTCDPRLVPDARKLDELSYDEMLEMASLGSKVMQSRSVEFAKKFGVKFEVRSSFQRQSRHHDHRRNPQHGKRGHPRPERGEKPGQGDDHRRARPARRGGQGVQRAGGGARHHRHDRAERFRPRHDGHFLHAQPGRPAGGGSGAAARGRSGRRGGSDGARAASPSSAWWASGCARIRAWRRSSSIAWGAAGINIQMISTSEIKIAVIIDEAEVAEAANLAHACFGLEQGPYTV